ncbi:iron-sulfur cluster assembly accessory protein [Cyclobacteriaceae bacterium]|nr:iron-sulfur cluster assembly accessory protein [Cyclobacteriaceae bacterium]
MIPLEITDKALSEIKDIKGSKGIPEDYHLRVGVRGGGCSGADYYVGFDQPTEEDKLFDKEGVQVIIAKKDFMYLIGVVLDFKDDADERGFDFIKD